MKFITALVILTLAMHTSARPVRRQDFQLQNGKDALALKYALIISRPNLHAHIRVHSVPSSLA